MKLERFASFLLGFLTAIANWVIFYYTAKYFNSTMPFAMATMLAGALVIHEIGHKVAMEYFGIRTHLIFLVLLGGASPDKRDIYILKTLHGNKLSIIYFAGVIGNFVAMFIGILMFSAGMISNEIAMQNININAILIFYNIFPLWITDGGRWAKLFFDSSPENKDFGWVLKIGIPIFMGAVFISNITPEFFLFTGPIMLWGLHHQSTHDDPNGTFSPNALTKRQRYAWAAFYLVIFITSMYLLGISPNWIR